MYDLIILGGGPAGVAAGVYASRKRLRTLFITTEFGGQSTVSPDIQNWIGSKHISGDELARQLEEHLKEYAGSIVDIKEKVAATDVSMGDESGVSVTLDNGETHHARALLVTTGSKRRQLAVPGAEEFDQKGLTYCATCDGPLFADQDVAVIGGGNAGFETAAQLLEYTKSVTLLHRGDAFKADPVTVDRVLSHEHMTGLTDAHTLEVFGDQFVKGLKYQIGEDGEEQTLDVTGIFVEIGLVPNTEFVSDVVELDDYRRIKIDPWTQQTHTPGIWAAGDCTTVLYHQNNISAGDGVRALEDIYKNLRMK